LTMLLLYQCWPQVLICCCRVTLPLEEANKLGTADAIRFGCERMDLPKSLTSLCPMCCKSSQEGSADLCDATLWLYRRLLHSTWLLLLIMINLVHVVGCTDIVTTSPQLHRTCLMTLDLHSAISCGILCSPENCQ
jgi:hypothetical protein